MAENDEQPESGQGNTPVQTVDPDRKARKKASPPAEKNNNRTPLSQKELTLHIHPFGVVKAILFVALLIGSFYLGKASGSLSGDDLSGFATGFLEGIAKEGKTVEVQGDLVEEVPAEEESAAVAAAEKAPANKPPEKALPEEVPEDIIRTYKHTTFTFDDLKTEWKGTWGKITEITSSITNSEDGTIKPAYITLNLEGYPEEAAKKADIHPAAKTIKKGQKVTQLRTLIPKGYAYNEKTTGDLAEVEATIMLYDDEDKLIAIAKKNVNLKISS